MEAAQFPFDIGSDVQILGGMTLRYLLLGKVANELQLHVTNLSKQDLSDMTS